MNDREVSCAGRTRVGRRLAVSGAVATWLLVAGCAGTDETQIEPVTSGAGGQGTGGGGMDAGVGGSGGMDTEPNACVSPQDAFAWPAAEDVAVLPHESVKTSINVLDDDFLSMPEGSDLQSMRWVKFVVLANAPDEIYFQRSSAYPFHYEFARDRIPAFSGMSRPEFDAVTLQSDGRRAILGAVLVPLDTFTYPEYGVQLVSNDDLHPELVERVMDTVVAHVTAPSGTRPYYFPSGPSATCVESKLADFQARGVDVGSVDRWLSGDACYAPGWAVGKLVQLGAAEVDAAYLDGRLTPDDVLLLSDTPPAELPFVAGILTLAPSTPNAHTAILARSYGVPFAYLRQADSKARAQALAGRRVVVSTTGASGRYLDPSFDASGCDLGFIDAEALSASEVAELRQVAAPPPVEVAPKRSAGALVLPADGLVPADIDRVGGKAAHFGLLRAAAPERTPSPALALTLDLWDAFMSQPAPGGAGTLREEITSRLAPHAWPADLRQLDTVLEGVRDLIRDASFPEPLAQSVRDALNGFDAERRIRFRSSTNVEDSETFTGAGLYDSATGCLADDLDADEAGPSRCNPEELSERGVYRAIQRVYASFYFRNAYFERLRRGVDEAEVGMGVLVHYSVPDPEELANGVATLTFDEFGGRTAQLVSQAGAVSVTNPDGSALPEEVRIDRFDMDYLLTLQSSSLIPLGGHVMNWESDYRSLMDLFNRAADRYAQITSTVPPFALDFEYKKVAPGELSLRQVRPLPLASTARDVTPFLVAEPTTLCVYGSERADVFATHRLKTRIALDAPNLWLSTEQLVSAVYDTVRVEYVAGSATAVLEGAPSTLPGASHTLLQDGEELTLRDDWTAASATWQLRARVPGAVPRTENPVRTFENLFFDLAVTWPDPVPYLSFDFENGGLVPGARSEELVELWGYCPDTVTTDASFLRQQRQFQGPGGLAIETDYWFPPTPRGVTVGYTAPVVKWEQTRITGLTSEPIVLSGYFSQTYAPYHHNFGGQYIFDPRLEPGLSPALLSELETANIAMVVVIDNDEPLEDEFWVLGVDGALREVVP